MMKSERKTEKWRIPGKWILIFLLILLAFYGYQNILAENYERQVVSWIGQTEKDRMVSAFTEPDEEAYQKGCEALKEAGYEETGKIWLEKRIRSYGIGVFVAAIGIICIVGLLTELHMEKRRNKHWIINWQKKTGNWKQSWRKKKNFCIVTGRKWELTWKIFPIS